MLVSVALSSGACISESPRAQDALERDGDAFGEIEETSLPPDALDTMEGEVIDPRDVLDTSDVPDVPDVGEVTDGDDVTDVTDSEVAEVTVEVVETSDDAIDALEVTPECDDHADCLVGRDAPGQCLDWSCRNGTCEVVAAAEGAACEDGDACSLGDTCRSGACVAGAERPTCPGDPSAQGCRVAACDPATGCTLRLAAEGAPCSNGTGEIPGTCVLGGFWAGDRCDGRGTCVDAPAPEPGADGAPTVEGDWFMVYTTFGRYADVASARALVRVDAADASFALESVHSYGPAPLVETASGFLCTKADGTLEARLGAERLIGHQLDGRLAVLSDTSNDALAVLVRADGSDARDVDGTYTYFQTTLIFGRAAPTAWRGTMTFEAGCMKSGSFLADPTHAGAYDFSTRLGGACLARSDDAGDEDLFELDTSVVAQVGDPTFYPIHYRGAVIDSGDILLLAKERDGTSLEPEYGITMLVRNSADSLSQASLAGSWRYNLHAQIGDAAPRRDVGSVLWDATGAITGGSFGTLDGLVVSSSGWARVGTTGRRVSQMVSLSDATIFQSGVVDPSGRFIVGWRVPTPPTGTQPAVLGDVPEGGSMLLMLRPR